jgi:hypothetical protein
MNSKLWILVPIVVPVAGALIVFSAAPSLHAEAEAAASSAQQAAPKPVEDDMHEFMEYVFQPTYLRLKASMAAAPADNAGWKAVKADALVLAEGGNLLLLRKPEEDAAAWNATSAAVRELGSMLYQAAKQKDYPNARKHYEAMLLKCNRCHDKFAGGEHQLAP